MSFNSKGKTAYAGDGTPYLYGTGDTITVPSNVLKLQPAALDTVARFGSHIDIGYDKIAVGGYLDTVSLTYDGSVHTYDLDGSNETRLLSPNPTASEYFGRCVAYGHGLLAVGATGEDTTFSASGAVYIFDKFGNYKFILKADAPQINAEFGFRCKIYGQRIIVSSAQYGGGTGRIYLYELDGTFIKSFQSSEPNSADLYGATLEAGNGRILVGARYEDGGAGDPKPTAGAVWVYDMDGNELFKLQPDELVTAAWFGSSASVGCGKIVVSAEQDDSPVGTFTGSAYIFDLDGNLIKKIYSPTGVNGEKFGTSISIADGRIVVGAEENDEGATGSGSAYIFDLDGNLLDMIKATDVTTNSGYGANLHIGSGKIAVGAWSLNGQKGAAYIYDTPTVYNLYDVIELNNGDV